MSNTHAQEVRWRPRGSAPVAALCERWRARSRVPVNSLVRSNRACPHSLRCPRSRVPVNSLARSNRACPHSLRWRLRASMGNRRASAAHRQQTSIVQEIAMTRQRHGRESKRSGCSTRATPVTRDGTSPSHVYRSQMFSCPTTANQHGPSERNAHAQDGRPRATERKRSRIQ